LLQEELDTSLVRFAGNSNEQLHIKSKDHRTRSQYIKALVNGWLAEVVAIESILKPLYGHDSIIVSGNAHHVMTRIITDTFDCIVSAGQKKILFDIKTFLSRTGMRHPETNKRAFAIKVNAASEMQIHAKRLGAQPSILWYSIREGLYHLMDEKAFLEITQTPVHKRRSWDKLVYLWQIPHMKHWTKVEQLWNRRQTS
jgi:hypothetical protein